MTVIRIRSHGSFTLDPYEYDDEEEEDQFDGVDSEEMRDDINFVTEILPHISHDVIEASLHHHNNNRELTVASLLNGGMLVVILSTRWREEDWRIGFNLFHR